MRAYEPPLLEFLDFLGALRARVAGTGIVVVPVPAPGQALRDTDVNTWRHALARRDDPRVYVEAAQ